MEQVLMNSLIEVIVLRVCLLKAFYTEGVTLKWGKIMLDTGQGNINQTEPIEGNAWGYKENTRHTKL